MTYEEKLVQQEGEPVGKHLLCDRLGATQQQLRVFAAFNRLLNQLLQQDLQDAAQTKHHVQ